MKHGVILALTTVIAAGPAGGIATASPPGDAGLAVLAAIDSLIARPLWPGFEPGRVPVAIGMREKTYLCRHPSPPKGFTQVPSRGDLWSHPGLYDSVRANTSAIVGGVRTATVLTGSAKGSNPRDLAGTAVHEMFHVFQDDRHPDWAPNELDRFVYPAADTLVITRRFLETAALRRALDARDADDLAAWTARAIQLRREQEAAMSVAAVKYESRMELREGLADYVRNRSLGRTPGAELIPAEDFAPEAVRDRAYASGCAWALLLDRLDPAWVARIDTTAVASLPDLVESTLAARAPKPAEFSPGDVAAAREAATRAVNESGVRLTANREAFMSRPGWKVAFITEKSDPFWVNKFDPMNIDALGGGELLHRRWLKVSGATFSLEARDCPVLTEGTGDQPLLSGIRSITLTGLAEKPEFVKGEKGTIIKGETFEAHIPKDGYWIEQEAEAIKVFLKRHPERVDGRRRG